MKNHFISKILFLAFASFAFAAPATTIAQKQYNSGVSAPRSFALDSRVRAFTYSPDVIFNLPVTVGMHTHIVLADDEELIEKPTLGETIQWRVSGNPKNLYVKALQPGVKTSMTLVTDKRMYQFELSSTTSDNARIQKAYFEYPDTVSGVSGGSSIQIKSPESRGVDRKSIEAAVVKRVEEESLDANFRKADNYVVTSNDSALAVEVFDDGVKTYMRMPSGLQDLPAVFMIDDGKLSPINYVVANRTERGDRDIMILERRSKEWMLKLGKSESRVTRK